MTDKKFRILLLAALLVVAGCDKLSSLAAGGSKPAFIDNSELMFRNLAYEIGKLKYGKSDFAALDALLGKAQAQAQRTPSGLWRYGLVLNGVQDAIGEVDSPAGFAAAEAKARQWLAARPDSPYAPIVLAYVYQAKACHCAREGDRPLPPAEQKAWNDKALSALSEHPRSLAVGERHALEVQLGTALGDDEATMRAFYQDGVRVQPGYFPLRFAWIDYLAAQPDGARRVEQAARAALSEAPFPDRDGLYARMLWYAAQTQYEDELFEEVPVDWPTFDRSFAALLAAYPDGWNRNNYARFACMAGHPERSAALMADHQPMGEVWDSQEEFDDCTATAQ